MKRWLGLLLAITASAQVPAPQIPLSGTAGAGGNFPFLNSGSFAMPGDADYTVTWPNTTCIVCTVTSSTTLTAARNLIEPALSMTLSITNATSGGQSITVRASSGTGVTVPNGQSRWVWFNGTNYVEIDGLNVLNGANLLAGTVATSALTSSSISVNSVTCPLGGSCTVGAGGYPTVVIGLSNEGSYTSTYTYTASSLPAGTYRASAVIGIGTLGSITPNYSCIVTYTNPAGNGQTEYLFTHTYTGPGTTYPDLFGGVYFQTNGGSVSIVIDSTSSGPFTMNALTIERLG
jgi:hypothetical protein